MTKRKRIKVIHTKLGRERAWGQAHIGEFSIRFYKYLCRVIHVKLFSFGYEGGCCRLFSFNKYYYICNAMVALTERMVCLIPEKGMRVHA